MAIIIPSKNIYDKNNPKIVDNAINKVEITAQSVSEKITQATDIITRDYTIEESNKESDYSQSITAIFDKFSFSLGAYKENIAIAYVSIDKLKNLKDDDEPIYDENGIAIGDKIITIKFPKIENNRKITKIYSLDNSMQDIDFKVRGVFQKGIIVFNFSTKSLDYAKEAPYKTIIENGVKKRNDSEITIGQPIPEKTIDKEDLDSSLISYKEEVALYDIFNNIKANASVEDTSVLNISEENGEYTIEISRPIGYEKYLGNFSELIATEIEEYLSNRAVVCDWEKFDARSLQIKVYGDVETIEFADKSLIVGKTDSTSSAFSVSSNELIQEGNIVYDVNALEYMYNNLIRQYENGKETAEILCSISDYYDTDGNKVIDSQGSNISKMVFDIGDEVIPMVLNEYRQEQPMSKYKDGTDKIFRVVSSEIFYDGAVWQKINLQEVT